MKNIALLLISMIWLTSLSQGQVRLKGFEGPFGRVLPDVHSVDGGVPAPFRMVQFDVWLWPVPAVGFFICVVLHLVPGLIVTSGDEYQRHDCRQVPVIYIHFDFILFTSATHPFSFRRRGRGMRIQF
jgi:hypothetical protein